MAQSSPASAFIITYHIPKILITPPPLDPQSLLDPTPCPPPYDQYTFKAWRARSRSLSVPAPGQRRADRIALARCGRASGSFKLNCVETPWARDDNGYTFLERLQLNIIDEPRHDRLPVLEAEPALPDEIPSNVDVPFASYTTPSKPLPTRAVELTKKHHHHLRTRSLQGMSASLGRKILATFGGKARREEMRRPQGLTHSATVNVALSSLADDDSDDGLSSDASSYSPSRTKERGALRKLLYNWSETA